jgi:PAS domain S-box-containing protein
VEKILLYLTQRSNLQLLKGWLAPRYTVLEAHSPASFDQPFDLCLIDGIALKNAWQEVLQRKSGSDEVSTPFLLLTTRQNLGKSAGELWKVIDDLILLPIERVELESRIRNLLINRRLSLELQRKNQEMLQESQFRLQVAVQSANIGLWEWSTELHRMWFSPELKGQLGFTADELSNDIDQWLPLIHPEDIDPTLEKFKAHIRNPHSRLEAEYRLRHKDGSYRNILAYGMAYRNESGAVTRILGAHVDITHIRHAQEQLFLLSSALQATANAVLLINDEQKIQWANPAFTHLTGFPLGEVLGQNPRFLDSGLQEDIFYRALWEVVLAGGTWKGERQNRRKDGSLYYEETTLTPIKNIHGQITHLIGVMQDITDRKRWEEVQEHQQSILEQQVKERTAELSLLNTSLAHAAKVKSEFLASMSHELRTPLTSILGLVEVLRSGIYGPLNEKMSNAMRGIEESGQHLLSLLNDVLDLAKIEAGKIELEIKPFSVASVVQSSIRLVRHNALKKRLEIMTHLDPAVPVIAADERRMKQILVNLLGNAIKFTPDGGDIGIDVNFKPVSTQVEFVVWDTGIGISDEDMQRLFKPFEQLDGGLDHKYSGTGLGLSLVYNLVELHHGGIQVESRLGAGSRFIVSLPLGQNREHNPAMQPTKADYLDARLTGKDISAVPPPVKETRQKICLLVEDNVTNRITLSDFLSGKGYQVIEAENGIEALNKAREFRPDVILMDIQMPVLDGLMAIQHLRQDDRFTATPVIALTALAMQGDRERCLAAGASDYMPKPVSMAELVNTMERLLA